MLLWLLLVLLQLFVVAVVYCDYYHFYYCGDHYCCGVASGDVYPRVWGVGRGGAGGGA